MGDTTAELRTRIAEAIHAFLFGAGAAPDGSSFQVADAVLPVVASLVADRDALREEVEELAIELADERTLHQALRAKVNALADKWERSARENEEALPQLNYVSDKQRFQVEIQAYELHARRLRALIVQVDQEERGDGQ